jgi:hypothetical protein
MRKTEEGATRPIRTRAGATNKLGGAARCEHGSQHFETSRGDGCLVAIARGLG